MYKCIGSYSECLDDLLNEKCFYVNLCHFSTFPLPLVQNMYSHDQSNEGGMK